MITAQLITNKRLGYIKDKQENKMEGRFPGMSLIGGSVPALSSVNHARFICPSFFEAEL
jgi:hypothetical protein